jgi:hypothetical protein
VCVLIAPASQRDAVDSRSDEPRLDRHGCTIKQLLPDERLLLAPAHSPAVAFFGSLQVIELRTAAGNNDRLAESSESGQAAAVPEGDNCAPTRTRPSPSPQGGRSANARCSFRYLRLPGCAGRARSETLPIAGRAAAHSAGGL